MYASECAPSLVVLAAEDVWLVVGAVDWLAMLGW